MIFFPVNSALSKYMQMLKAIYFSFHQLLTYFLPIYFLTSYLLIYLLFYLPLPSFHTSYLLIFLFPSLLLTVSMLTYPHLSYLLTYYLPSFLITISLLTNLPTYFLPTSFSFLPSYLFIYLVIGEQRVNSERLQKWAWSLAASG